MVMCEDIHYLYIRMQCIYMKKSIRPDDIRICKIDILKYLIKDIFCSVYFVFFFLSIFLFVCLFVVFLCVFFFWF